MTERELPVQVDRRKDDKALGEDGIENEAWKSMTRRAHQPLLKLLNKILGGDGMPADWKREVVRPIFKKGDSSMIKNY